jgi:hypothetical protein
VKPPTHPRDAHRLDDGRYSLQELERRDGHRAHYINWLKDSRAARVEAHKAKTLDSRAAKTKRDRRDPHGVDLAMDRRLAAPIPALPPAQKYANSVCCFYHRLPSATMASPSGQPV